MKNAYFIEEGHLFDYEEYYSWVIWKVIDLFKNGCDEQMILSFEENDLWLQVSKKVLTKLNKSNQIK
jgi:hypothetical protein